MNVPVVNNISDGLKKKIEERKAALPEVVIFRGLKRSKILSKSQSDIVEQVELYHSVALSGRSVIVDPYSTPKNQRVVIGVVTGFTIANNHTFGFKLIDGLSDSGVMRLHKGIDDDWIDYLLIAPFVEGNLLKSDTEKTITLVDVTASAKERNIKGDKMLDAMKAASTLKDTEIRSFVASLNQDETQDIEILKDIVKDMAISNPELFDKLLNDPEREVKATIRRAIDLGVVTINPVDNSLSLASTGQVLVTLHHVEGADILSQFASYKSAAGTKGDVVYKLISDSMKTK